MATEKPRIQVTLDPIVYESVRRFASLRGDSMSAVVSDMIDLVVPSFDRMSHMMERLASAEGDIQRGVLEASLEAEKQFEFIIGQAGDRDVQKRALSPAGSSPKKPGPPSTNRGVRIPPSNPRKPRAHAASKPIGKGERK